MSDLKNLVYCEREFKVGTTRILYDKITSGSKNLYIVSTPLQLLCCIEAQNYFKTDNNILVILIFLIGDGKNIDQMFELSNSFPYSKLITYKQGNKININSFKKYILELKKYHYSYLFFGYGTPIYRRMVANIDYEKLYMLDDGTHSLTIHAQLKKNINKRSTVAIQQESKSYFKIMRNLSYRLAGIKVDAPLDDVNFFTMFAIVYKKSITHDFSYVKKIFMKKCMPSSKVFILGQPLIQAIGMGVSQYIHYIEILLEKNKGCRVVYIPHRTEQVGNELEYILDTHNVSILNISSPIEIFFMENGIYPKFIYSFISSALFTLKKIFPNSNLKYIGIDTSPYSEFHQKNIQLIYDNYKKEGIERLTFHDK